MLRDLGTYLPDFGAPKVMSRIEPARDSLEQQLADAERRGRQAAHDEARLEARQLLDIAQQAADQRLAEERTRWVAEQADRLAASFEACAAATETRLSETIARVLAPLLDAATREEMLGDLRQTLVRLIEDGHGRIRIAGPADLVEALQARLGEASPRTEWLASPSVEVSIECGDTVIETQLGAWRDRLAAAIAGGPYGRA